MSFVQYCQGAPEFSFRPLKNNKSYSHNFFYYYIAYFALVHRNQIALSRIQEDFCKGRRIPSLGRESDLIELIWGVDEFQLSPRQMTGLSFVRVAVALTLFVSAVEGAPPPGVFAYVARYVYDNLVCSGEPVYIDVENWGTCLQYTLSTSNNAETYTGVSFWGDPTDGINVQVTSYANSATCSGTSTQSTYDIRIRSIDQQTLPNVCKSGVPGAGLSSKMVITTTKPSVPANGRWSDYYGTEADCLASRSPTGFSFLPVTPNACFSFGGANNKSPGCDSSTGVSMQSYASSTCSGTGTTAADPFGIYGFRPTCTKIQKTGNGDNLHYWVRDSCSPRQSLFFSRHVDAKCSNQSYAISWPRVDAGAKMRINKCMNLAAGNVKVACKIMQKKFSLMAYKYGASDTTCSGTPLDQTAWSVTSIFKHEYTCQQNHNGGYMKIHCGEDTSPLLSSSVYSVSSPRLFSDRLCALGAPVSRTALLGVCTPSYKGYRYDTGPIIEFNFVLSVVGSSPLAVKMTKYNPKDTTCARRIEGFKNFAYTAVPSVAPSVPTCLADPLNPNFYYRNTGGEAPFVRGLAPGQTSAPVPAPVPTAAISGSGPGSGFNTGSGSFLITNNYVTAGCSGVPTSVMITPIGVCRLAGTSYQKVLVSGETYAYASYSDSQCTVPSGGDPYYQSSSCSSYNGNYYQPSVATSYDLSALFSGSSDVIVR